MLARIVLAGQSTPHRGFGLGLVRLPVEITAKPWKLQWKPASGNHSFADRVRASAFANQVCEFVGALDYFVAVVASHLSVRFGALVFTK